MSVRKEAKVKDIINRGSGTQGAKKRKDTGNPNRKVSKKDE